MIQARAHDLFQVSSPLPPLYPSNFVLLWPRRRQRSLLKVFASVQYCTLVKVYGITKLVVELEFVDLR